MMRYYVIDVDTGSDPKIVLATVLVSSLRTLHRQSRMYITGSNNHVSRIVALDGREDLLASQQALSLY